MVSINNSHSTFFSHLVVERIAWRSIMTERFFNGGAASGGDGEGGNLIHFVLVGGFGDL